MLHIISSSRPHFSSLILSFAFCVCLSVQVSATQTDITGPAGSGTFGNTVTVLPNGNIVVIDTGYDLSGPTVLNVGAVHLYNGATLALISTLTGSTASDQVGVGGITVLTNGNYVVSSRDWDNPSPLTTNVGAVTWCSATTGCSGVVSAANSLVGGTASDQVGGFGGVTALTNGNYVVISFNWDNPSLGASNDAGAVTWGDGTTGTVGVVSASNSLIGGTATDQVGIGVTALTNGNYVVQSQNWDNPSPVTANVGAVTWGNGTSGTSGLVTASNSLVGGTATDQVGFNGVTALTNGNYVVNSFSWDNPSPVIADVGAETWGNGAGGTSGLVTASNSLVGGTASDQVGSSGVTALTGGNYVVRSPSWDNPSPLITQVGAATWGNGTGGTVGIVTAANSLVGGTASDAVGSGVTALTNGNYVVISPNWDIPSDANVGAVTWGNGTSGTSGLVTVSNSLVGGRFGDLVGGGGVTVLTNGNYVVRSIAWDNPSLGNDAGAVTWGNGTGGPFGTINPGNSLIGGTLNDNVGSSVTALTNGNYVVGSQNWDQSPLIPNAGAATWGNGAGGTSGLVTASNSLIGRTENDNVGGGGVTVLTNGNYVVRSASWGQPVGFQNEFGAVTWGNGTTGTIGLVSPANSLVGGTGFDRVGTNGVKALTNGNYVVNSTEWDNPSPVVVNATAVTFGNGAGGTNGLITNGATGGNSVVGTVANGTNAFAFDAARNRLVVGRQASNTVSILSFTTTATADGDLSNAANWDSGVPNGLLTGVIPSGRTMSISSVMNIGQIQVQCGGNLTGGGAAAYIVGSVRRDFCAAANESFTFPIGNGGNYSPLMVSNANGTGNLTAAVTDTFMPGLPQTASSLSRYWSLEGAGITADLTFNYVNADVNGTEGDYKVFRRPVNNNALVAPHTPSSVDTANNTITAFGVSQFSDWGAAAQPLAPPVTPTATSTNTSTPTNTATNTPTDTPTPAGTPTPGGCAWTASTVYPINILDGASATVGANLYVFGGVSNSVIIANANKFDGTTWTAIAPLPTALEFPTAVTDGTNIFILGGNTSTPQTTLYRYNVASDTYTTLAPFTTGTWNQATVYLNGKIYKFTGTGPATASTNVLEIYDVAANTWSTGAVYPLSASFVSAFAQGNFIYAAGGVQTVGPVESLKTYRYDPVANTWDDAAMADLPATRRSSASGFYNGGGVMAGGFVGGSATANISNTAISWDPGTNTWLSLPNMLGERARMTGAILGGSFYVIGGRSIASSGFVGTNDNQKYTCSSSISGTITYGNAIGNPVPPRFVKNVSVASTAGSPAVGPIITGTPGTYTLTGFGAGSYAIKPTKPGGSNGAITSNDAARVAQGVVASPGFVSQNQRFAADVSGNGGVTSNDAALIARFAAGLTGTGNAGQWKFFVTGAPSPLPTVPQTYDDSRTYASVSSNLTGEDFVGILVGEVSGNWNPTSHPRPGGSVESGESRVESEDSSDQWSVGSGPVKNIAVEMPQMTVPPDKEIIIPVSVQGVADKQIISYEFDLRYDPSVIQPLENPVDVAGTVSRGLSVVVNPYEPGLLRVVIYGALPIDENGVLLNLRFTAVGASGSVSPLTWERIMFNEGESLVTATDGRVELF